MDIVFILKAILLGIVQGLTEFLPISSTGHLIIVQEFIDFPQNAFSTMFSVVIQLASILAVLILFWPRIWVKLKSFFKGEREGRNFMLIWVVGVIPAAVAGFLLNDFIDTYLFSVPTVAAALIVGAIVLLLTEKHFAPKAVTKQVEEITWKQAVGVGMFQVLALWPGFSRSASTIIGGWVMGMTTWLAADYSFFLAIPVMFGASGFSLFKYFRNASELGYATAMTGNQVAALIAGCIASFIVALLVVRAFMAFLRTHSMRGFAIYRLLVGAVLIALIIGGIMN